MHYLFLHLHKQQCMLTACMTHSVLLTATWVCITEYYSLCVWIIQYYSRQCEYGSLSTAHCVYESLSTTHGNVSMGHWLTEYYTHCEYESLSTSHGNASMGHWLTEYYSLWVWITQYYSRQCEYGSLTHWVLLTVSMNYSVLLTAMRVWVTEYYSRWVLPTD